MSDTTPGTAGSPVPLAPDAETIARITAGEQALTELENPYTNAERTGSVIALSASNAVDNSEGGLMRVFSAGIMTAFDLSNASLGVLLSLGMWARMIFGPLWSLAADRFGRKKVLFIVTGLWGFWTISAGFVPNYTMLLILYGIAAMGTVASEPITNGLMGDLFDKKSRGKAYGTIRGAGQVFALVLTPMLAIFGNNPNAWRYGLWMMGGLSVVSGVLILFLVPKPKHQLGKLTEDPDVGIFKLADAAKLFKIPTIALMAPMLLLITSMVMIAYMGVIWVKVNGFTQQQQVLLQTTFSAGMAISSILGGFLADWFVKRFGPKGRVLLMQSYLVAFAGITWVTFQIPFGTAPVYWVVVFSLGLIFSIGFSGCVLPMVSTVCPKQLSATAFAVLFSLTQGAITAIYTMGVGKLADLFGYQNTMLWFVTIPYLLNAGYWFVFYKTYPKDAALQEERTIKVANGQF